MTNQLILDFASGADRATQDAAAGAAEPGVLPPAPPANLSVALLGAAAGEIFDRVFECIEIAEEEIERAKRNASPRLRDAFHSSFAHLQPTEILGRVSLDAYRSHARELLVRIASEDDLRPGTEAEVLAGLCAVSLEAPLNPIGFLLYARLFRSVFPAATAHHHDSPYSGQRYHEDEADAMLQRARRRLASRRGFGTEGATR